MDKMRIEFGTGIIRNWRESDEADLAEFANNRNIWRNMADRFPHPYTAADAKRWIEQVAAMPVQTHWTIGVEDRAIGGTGVDLHDGMYARSAAFGYWLGEPYWGRGIATSVARTLVPAAMTRFGLLRLEAHVFEWNAVSMRVLEKAGFKKDGFTRCSAIKNDIVVKQVLYALVDEHATAEPRHVTDTR